MELILIVETPFLFKGRLKGILALQSVLQSSDIKVIEIVDRNLLQLQHK